MKVRLVHDEADPQWLAVARQVVLEGDEVGEGGLELDFRTETLPSSTLAALGYRVSHPVLDPLLVTRWFDGNWHPQEYLGAQVLGLMNEDLGPRIPAGYGGRYGSIPGLWTPQLAETLRKMKVRNFVTFSLSLEGVISLITGVPFPGLFCILEGVPCRIAEWLSKPRELLESSTISVVVSRSPWPVETWGSRATVQGLGPQVSKHFWAPFLEQFRKGIFTESTLVGCATGWASSLAEANSRALISCRAVEVEGKQFRTDIASRVRLRLEDWRYSRFGNIIPPRRTDTQSSPRPPQS